VIQDFVTGKHQDMEPKKRLIVFVGAVFLQDLLKALPVSEILISPWSIREAYVLKHML